MFLLFCVCTYFLIITAVKISHQIPNSDGTFPHFPHLLMIMFRVLYGECIEPLWDCLRAYRNDQKLGCYIFFVSSLAIGNFLMLNVFLALQLNSFNVEEVQASFQVDTKKIVQMLPFDERRDNRRQRWK
ncbi:sodium channel protein 60E-like isoform X2 [Tachypleus tridentatus]|uniref:sodium channel protein 60E-like isoform X2 n=1 Tax=Tachypleus tridentatus TaxID=6853 RepID=UPI003FD3CA20